MVIDKQKALRRDFIYNLENTDLEIGVLGVYLHLLSYFDTHRCSSPTGSFLRITHHAFEIEWSKGHYSEVVEYLYNVEHFSETILLSKDLSVYDRLFLRKAKFMFKDYNGLAVLTPSYISDIELRNEMDMSVNLMSPASGYFIPPLPKKQCSIK